MTWNDRFQPHTLDYLEPLFSHFLTVILLALADLSILTRFFFSFLTNIVQSMADSGASHRLDLRVGGKYRPKDWVRFLRCVTCQREKYSPLIVILSR